MPTDYLLRLPGEQNQVAAFDPFQTNLKDLQLKDPTLIILKKIEHTWKWPASYNTAQQKHTLALLQKLFRDKNGLIWVLLNDYNYPRTDYSCQNSIGKTHSLCEITMEYLEDTMQPPKHILRSPLPTSGHKCIKMCRFTSTAASNVSNENLPQKSQRL
jgi:hypothetical protein